MPWSQNARVVDSTADVPRGRFLSRAQSRRCPELRLQEVAVMLGAQGSMTNTLRTVLSN